MKIGDFIVWSASEGQSTRNEDRVVVIDRGDYVLLAVADGSGGSGYGAQAAQTAIEQIESMRFSASWSDALFWVEQFRRIDLMIESSCSGGETTLVVTAIGDRRIAGASVGDSKALLVREESLDELTHLQKRKPLLGSGAATPVAFASNWYDQLLVLATDGLVNYLAMLKLQIISTQSELHRIPTNLIDAVRLSSGMLQDDTTLIVAKRDEAGI